MFGVVEKGLGYFGVGLRFGGKVVWSCKCCVELVLLYGWVSEIVFRVGGLCCVC